MARDSKLGQWVNLWSGTHRRLVAVEGVNVSQMLCEQ